jgi:hypothetical protein
MLFRSLGGTIEVTGRQSQDVTSGATAPMTKLSF